MDSVKELEGKLLECAKLGDEFIADYEKLVFETRELRNTVRKLETERRELRRKIEGIAERVENHLRARA